MELFCWILGAFLAYGGLATVSSVGKPRGPVTNKLAVTVVFVTACEVTGLALVATGVLR
jgi:hypothetical protein